MDNSIYDIHYGRLEIDAFANITQNDLDRLVRIAESNGCREVIKWVGDGQYIVLATIE